MLKFYPSITKSVCDVIGETSLMVHLICKCNFNCYGCLNKSEIMEFSDDRDDYLTIENIFDKVKLNGFIFSNIIFSGGEITYLNQEQLESLKKLILEIKDIYNGRIILYTNGSNYNKLIQIYDSFDYIYMDIKFPYFVDDAKYIERYKLILGRVITDDLINNISKCVNLVKNKGEFRTVKYPILTNEDILSISEYTKVNKLKWNINNYCEVK